MLLWVTSALPANAVAQGVKAPFADRLEIIALLRAQEFGALERWLGALQEAYQARRVPETRVEHAFGAFMNSAPDLKLKLDAWIAAWPDSYAAYVARGAYFWHLGWLSRQFSSAAFTSDAEWTNMRQFFAAAERDLGTAIAINPELSMAHAMRVTMFSVSANRQAALNAYRQGLTAIPHSYLIRHQYLHSLRPQWGGSLEAVRQFLSETQAQQIPNPEIYKLRSILYRSKARFLWLTDREEEAIQALTEGLRKAPHWRAYWERGQKYHARGKYDRAIEDFNRALDLHPQNAAILEDRSESYRRAGKLDQALKDLNLAVALDALFPSSLAKRAFLLRVDGKYEAALDDLNAALTYGAHKAFYWAERGDIYYYYLRDYTKAAADFKRATEIDDRFPFFWYKYGHSLYFAKDCDMGDALMRYLVLCRVRGNCKTKNHLAAVHGYRFYTRSWRCPFDRNVIVVPIWQKLKAWFLVLKKPVARAIMDTARAIAAYVVWKVRDIILGIEELFGLDSKKSA